MIFRKEKRVAMFFPENEKECMVYRTWDRLKEKRQTFFGIFKRPTPVYYLLQKSGFLYPRLNDSQSEKLATIESVVVFAHKHEEYPLLNSTCNERISYEWFGNKMRKPVSVLMVSQGAQLFTDRRWEKIFGSWISFGGKFNLLEDLEIARREADLIFPQIVHLAGSEKDVVKLKEGITAAFNKSIYKLSTLKRPVTSDEQMTVLLLKLNRDNLVCSLDKEYSRV